MYIKLKSLLDRRKRNGMFILKPKKRQHTHPLFLREGDREAAVLKGGKSPCSAGRINVSLLNKGTCKAI